MDITDSYIYFLGRFDKGSNLQEVIKFYDVEGIIEITREDFEGKYQKELNKNEARLFWKEKLAEDFKRIENYVALNFIEEAEKVRIAEGKTGDYTYSDEEDYPDEAEFIDYSDQHPINDSVDLSHEDIHQDIVSDREETLQKLGEEAMEQFIKEKEEEEEEKEEKRKQIGWGPDDQ